MFTATNEQRRDGRSIERVADDGAPCPVLDEDLQVFKDELRLIQSQATKSVMSRRIINEETRFCIWEGQADDGRKHDDTWSEKKAFPFDGASDARVRMADDVVEDRRRLCMAAWTRGEPKIVSRDLQGADWGERMATLLNHEVHTVMGMRARTELKRFLEYVHGDSPAASVMGVYWHQETGLRMEEVKLEDLVGLVVQELQKLGVSVSEPEEVELLALLQDASREAEALELFKKYFPRVKPGRAAKAVRQLRTEGVCSIPMPYIRANEPRWVAHRLFEDLFLPPNSAGDFQRVRYYHVREWLTEAEIREKAVSEGWDGDFCEEVLKFEGKTFFPEYYRARMNEIELRQASVEENKGYYEIIRTYFRATNEDGIMGVYLLTWHHQVDYAAHDRVLLDYPHGQYPGVFLARETLNVRLLDSRGVPELMMTDQWSAKTLHDLTMDRATITTIPPVFVPANRPDVKLKIAPLGQIKRNRKDDYEAMSFGAAQDHDKALARIERRSADYFGQPHPEIAEAKTTTNQQDFVDDFLAALGEIYWMTLQLCQAYLSGDELRAITGAANDEPLFRGTEEIQGKFGLRMAVNIGDVTNQEALVKKIEVIAEKVLPMDSLSTVQRDKLTRWAMRGIDPNLAADVTVPVDVATQRELDDEDGNLAKIMAGIEPPMAEAGQNFGARLQRLLDWPQRNPAMAQRIQTQPDSLAMYQARLKHLQFMVAQQNNKQIGRLGAKPALPETAGVSTL